MFCFQDLVEVLVPEAAGRVAIARLLLAEYGEVDPCCLHDLREGHGDSLGAIVEGSHAAYPEQHVRTMPALQHLRHREDLESLRPLTAVRGAEVPGRSNALHVLEGGLYLGREPRLHEHEIA